MGAALKIGAARGCDLAVLSELLPAAEAGLVEALVAIEFWTTDLDHVDNIASPPDCGNIDVQTSLPKLTHRHSDGQLWVRKVSFCFPKAEGTRSKSIECAKTYSKRAGGLPASAPRHASSYLLVSGAAGFG